MGNNFVRIALLFVALAGSACQGDASPSHSRQITPVVSVANWKLIPHQVFTNGRYAWLSDHELLHFGGDGKSGYQALSYNTRTRADVPEPNLNVVQQGHMVSASPDGQWVLWNTHKALPFEPGMAATRRSDGKTVYWPRLQPSRGVGFWLPDSRRWVCLEDLPNARPGDTPSRQRLDVCRVDHPGVRSTPIPKDRTFSALLGVDARGQAVLVDPSSERTTPVGPASLRLAAHRAVSAVPPLRWLESIKPDPQTGQDYFIFLSPQGDHLLWSLNVVNAKAVGISFHSARLDGSPPQDLGAWYAENVSKAGAIQWNPDGKHVSFDMQDVLYSVSVE